MPAANVGRQDAFGPYGRRCQNVKMSNESPEKGLPCAKIRIGDREGPSRAIRKMQVVAFPVVPLSFVQRKGRSADGTLPEPSVWTSGRQVANGRLRPSENENR